MGPPNTYVSSIQVADGGAAVAAALTVPAGTYNIVDDEPLTKRAYADALAAAAGKRLCLRVPGRLALLLGDRSTSLTRSLRVSNARFREASGVGANIPKRTRRLDSNCQVPRKASGVAAFRSGPAVLADGGPRRVGYGLACRRHDDFHSWILRRRPNSRAYTNAVARWRTSERSITLPGAAAPCQTSLSR